MAKAKTAAAQRAAVKKYDESKDRILCRFPAGTKDRIARTGAESANAFIVSIILDALDAIEQGDVWSEEDVAEARAAKEEAEKSGLSHMQRMAQAQALAMGPAVADEPVLPVREEPEEVRWKRQGGAVFDPADAEPEIDVDIDDEEEFVDVFKELGLTLDF